MGKSEARRQKQLAKKKAKRQEKRTILTRESSKDPTIRFVNVAQWPILDVQMADNLWSLGLGPVIVTRLMPSGEAAMGVFLVDVYCLGVKNCYYKMMSRNVYAEYVDRLEEQGPLRKVSPEYAAKLVTEAVAFAESFGFAPNVDYRHAKLLLAGIDAEACPDEMTFGRDGKPYYIRGPHESLSHAQRIGHQVQQAGGNVVMIMDGLEDRLDDFRRGQLIGGKITELGDDVARLESGESK